MAVANITLALHNNKTLEQIEEVRAWVCSVAAALALLCLSIHHMVNQRLR
jgi:hypothetical protein